MELHIDTAPSDAAVAELRAGLIGHNISRHGYADVHKAAIFIRNEDGSLGAGIYSYMWGGCCEIDLLWVSEERRGEGLGTRLMYAVEEEARRVGCTQLILDTFSFQAPKFYERLGFIVTGTIEDFPEGHTHYQLVKSLT